jgi:hypothetical protein
MISVETISGMGEGMKENDGVNSNFVNATMYPPTQHNNNKKVQNPSIFLPIYLLMDI